jgi:photosystem II stability/assembly factor-like uncharacterized protein
MKRTILIAAVVLLLGAGCIQVTGTTQGNSDGGLWVSADKGVHWTQKSAIAVVGAPRSFTTANITAVAFDPSDAKAVYVGTDDRGLLYSYDAAETWHETSALGAVHVNAVAVSPGNKCVIFVATGNRVMRSRDCSRTWENVYVDTRADANITGLTVDFFNSANVWASTSAGDLIKSSDSGASWFAVRRFEASIRQFVMSSADSRVLWVLVEAKSLWRTTDAGATWTDLTPTLKDFDGVLDTNSLAEDRATPNAMLLASRYGLIRTTDGGAAWKTIPLLTPTGGTTIFSLVVHPQNSKEIWYGTGNTLYHSVDGGAKWTTSRLPTTRAATSLAVNPENPGTLYLGVTLYQQKKLF